MYVNSQVRFQAVKAVCAFIMLHAKEDQIHKFLIESLAPIIQVKKYILSIGRIGFSNELKYLFLIVIIIR